MTIEQYIMKVLSVSKIGKKYSKDDYALENYEELEALSLDMLNQTFEAKVEENLFVRDIYPTPNVSVRVMIVNENDKVLFVKEADEKKWTVPGGWCDLFLSAQDNAIKEVSEEVGIDVTIDRMLAVFLREKYRPINIALSDYVMYFKATVPSDIKFNIGFEVEDAAWYSMDDLPELATKATDVELLKAWEILKNNKEVYFD